jgi:eukaryotic-like serine/threonine-protein kinase
MELYLFLPHTGTPPYQTVLYCPGSDGFYLTSLDQYSVMLDFVLKSGRAVAFPVYKQMFERGNGGGIPFTNMHEVQIKHIKDLRRSIDYLETRSDIDAGSLGYFGYSWGSGLGPPLLTMEPRLKTGVLYAAGFFTTEPVEGNIMQPIHYLPRIKVPVLMLNGELDNLYPLEASARPFFDLIGTPAADKKLVIAPSGHFVPRDLLIRETLDWMDNYLGKPRPGK